MKLNLTKDNISIIKEALFEYCQICKEYDDSYDMRYTAKRASKALANIQRMELFHKIDLKHKRKSNE